MPAAAWTFEHQAIAIMAQPGAPIENAFKDVAWLWRQ